MESAAAERPEAALEEMRLPASGVTKTLGGDWRSGMVVGALVCTRMGTPVALGFSTNFWSRSSTSTECCERLRRSSGEPWCTDYDLRISLSLACYSFFFL